MRSKTDPTVIPEEPKKCRTPGIPFPKCPVDDSHDFTLYR